MSQSFIVLLMAVFILQLNVAKADDTVVTPPRYGTIQVNGIAGAGQTAQYDLSRCETTPQIPKLYSSCKWLNGHFGLNKPYSVLEGNYLIYYRGSRFLNAIVSSGRKTSASLVKLIIPPTDLKFYVFVDFTNQGEIKQDLYARWMSDGGDYFYRYVCYYTKYKDICDALNSSPQAQLNKTVFYNDKAERFSVAIYRGDRHWDNDGRLLVNDLTSTGTTGTFVSVFPGTYGIGYWDEKLGVGTSQYGIHAVNLPVDPW